MSNPTEKQKDKEDEGLIERLKNWMYVEDEDENNSPSTSNIVPEQVLEDASATSDLVDSIPSSNENLPTEDGKNIIVTAYQDLEDETSVFKLSQMLQTVDQLPDDQKRETVLGMLKAMGFSLDHFIQDGSERLTNLETLLKSFSNKETEEIQLNAESIKLKENEIDELKGINFKKSENLKKTKAFVIQEQKKIANILKFMKPNLTKEENK